MDRFHSRVGEMGVELGRLIWSNTALRMESSIDYSRNRANVLSECFGIPTSIYWLDLPTTICGEHSLLISLTGFMQ